MCSLLGVRWLFWTQLALKRQLLYLLAIYHQLILLERYVFYISNLRLYTAVHAFIQVHVQYFIFVL